MLEIDEETCGQPDREDFGDLTELHNDELVIYGVIPIELVEELSQVVDWKRKEQIVEQIQFIVETLPQSKVHLISQFADSFL